METTAVKQMVKLVPTGKVSFRNLKINPKDLSFSIEYAYLEGKKRKYNYQEAKGHVTRRKYNYQEVKGHVTLELFDWFTKVFIEKSETVSENKTTTAFKKYLDRKGIEFKPGILSELKFESLNNSIDFDDCPFRLTISETYSSSTLNLVYKFPKVVKGERLNMETGEVIKTFGYKKYQNMKKDYYRRLEIFTSVEI